MIAHFCTLATTPQPHQINLSTTELFQFPEIFSSMLSRILHHFLSFQLHQRKQSQTNAIHVSSLWRWTTNLSWDAFSHSWTQNGSCTHAEKISPRCLWQNWGEFTWLLMIIWKRIIKQLCVGGRLLHGSQSMWFKAPPHEHSCMVYPGDWCPKAVPSHIRVTDLNSGFSFSLTGCHTKIKELSMPYYQLLGGE